MSAAAPAMRITTARAVIAPISRPVKNTFGVIEADHKTGGISV
jgi:hypothetical protein